MTMTQSDFPQTGYIEFVLNLSSVIARIGIVFNLHAVVIEVFRCSPTWGFERVRWTFAVGTVHVRAGTCACLQKLDSFYKLKTVRCRGWKLARGPGTPTMHLR